MRLYIAEKPDLARAIADGLGGGKKCDGYIDCGDNYVTWCFGHMLALFDPEDYDEKYSKWNMADLPIVHIPWKRKIPGDKKKQVNIILNLLKKADSVVHAGDPDEEGQLLVDELLEYANCKLPVQRVLINDNTPSVVKKSLSNLKPNSDFAGLSAAAEARTVADQAYGYNGTRLYTLAGRSKGFNGVLSVGRVQTPILGLVVRRDLAHESHKASYYYNITGRFEFSMSVSARYVPKESDPVDEKNRIIDESFATSIMKACAKSNEAPEITSVKVEVKKEQPPLPYNLLKLQADASRKFGLKPDVTLSVTQALREKHRLITYNRSDCEYLSEEQHEDSAQVLSAVASTAPMLSKASQVADPAIKSRAFNSKKVSAHHAIIPTQSTANLESLTENEKNIYLLIARAYVAQFFPPHEYRATAVTISCAGHEFRQTSKTTLKPGWLSLYKNDKGNDELPNDEGCKQDLSSLSEGEKGDCRECGSETQETKPPARYTMTALLKDLTRVSKYVTDPKLKALLKEKDKEKEGEHGGIGTPATRSSIIKNLFDRGFLSEKGKQIISTETGRNLFHALPEQATSPDMTALWHEQQKDIQAGNLSVTEFVKSVVRHIEAEISRVNENGLTTFKVTGEKCPDCDNGILQRRKGKKGFFWGCNQYPECKAILPDKKGKPDKSPKKQAPVASDKHHCTSCGKGLVRRPGKRKGSFWWGCSGFPECKQTFFDSNGSPELTKKTA